MDSEGKFILPRSNIYVERPRIGGVGEHYPESLAPRNGISDLLFLRQQTHSYSSVLWTVEWPKGLKMVQKNVPRTVPGGRTLTYLLSPTVTWQIRNRT